MHYALCSVIAEEINLEGKNCWFCEGNSMHGDSMLSEHNDIFKAKRLLLYSKLLTNIQINIALNLI